MEKKKTLLIVDDSIMIVARLYELLSDVAAVEDISFTKSFDETVNFLGRRVPDVILLDLNLNGRSGMDLLHYLKANHYHTKVIVITNEANPHYKETCLNLGADHFIDKSQDFETIPDIIASL
jgi:DNA-binding NarL/FixJ family response regulator